jgi:N4-gp56 family major capsid protein
MASGIISYLSDVNRLAKTKIDSDIRIVSQALTQFRSLAKPIKSFGAHKGQAVEIEKFSKLAKASTPISELATMPMQRPSINFTTVTVLEYGSGVPYTTKAMTIAEYAVDESLKKLIAMNVAESMDTVAGASFTGADVFYTPKAGNAGVFDKTSGVISQTATANLTSYDLRTIVKNMKKDNVPRWDGNRYLGVFSPFAIEQLFEDTTSGSIVDIHKYDMPEVLINGELGMYFGLRLVEETNVLSNTLGGTSYMGSGVIMGFEPVVEAIATPEHILVESWNFGRFTGIAWRTFTGFQRVWTNNTDGEYHLVYITSL